MPVDGVALRSRWRRHATHSVRRRWRWRLCTQGGTMVDRMRGHRGSRNANVLVMVVVVMMVVVVVVVLSVLHGLTSALVTV